MQTRIRQARRAARTLSLVALAIMIAAFAAPWLRRSSAITRVGERAIAEMEAFSTAVSYYSVGPDLRRMIENPAVDDDYKYLSRLLALVMEQKGYRGLYLVVQDGPLHRVLVDGAYRDNAIAGMDYYAPGEIYSETVPNSTKRLLDRMFGGDMGAGYDSSLLTRADRRQVAAVYLPVYGSGRSVAAVLGVECDPGDTAYDRLGPVNLVWVGWGAAALLLLSALVWVLTARFARPEAPDAVAEPEQETAPAAGEPPEQEGKPDEEQSV